MSVGDKVRMRWFIQADLRACVDIDALAYDDFWGEPEFTAHLRKRNGIAYIAESDEEIRGYICYESMEDHFRIVRLAVHPDDRRQGYGRYLLSRLERKFTARKCHADAVLNERNVGGLAFMRACGYRALQVLRGEFGEDDGYLMRKVMG